MAIRNSVNAYLTIFNKIKVVLNNFKIKLISKGMANNNLEIQRWVAALADNHMLNELMFP